MKSYKILSSVLFVFFILSTASAFSAQETPTMQGPENVQTMVNDQTADMLNNHFLPSDEKQLLNQKNADCAGNCESEAEFPLSAALWLFAFAAIGYIRAANRRII